MSFNGGDSMAARNRQDIKFTLSTQAMEGIAPSRQAIRLCKRLSDGTVSADAAVEAIKAKHGLTRGNLRVRRI